MLVAYRPRRPPARSAQRILFPGSFSRKKEKHLVTPSIVSRLMGLEKR